jgi:hypothetical protein
MKKFIFFIFLVISTFANSIPSNMASIVNGTTDFLKNCAIISSEDITKNDDFLADSNKCFNAYDISFTSAMGVFNPVSLSTKTAGKDFVIKIVKKSTCNVSAVTVSLVDNETGNIISGTTQTISNPLHSMLKFNIPDIYKNVSVKFDYSIESIKLKNIGKCHTYSAILDSKNDINSAGIFAVPTNYKCYTIKNNISSRMGVMNVKHTTIEVAKTYCNTATNIATNTTNFMNNFLSKFGFKNHFYFKVAIDWNCYKIDKSTTNKIDYSTDEFSIKPSKFTITLKKSTIKRGSIEPMDLKVVNDTDAISNNYQNDSTNLKVAFDPSDTTAQYEFDINNGVLQRSSLSFAKAESDVYMKITDEHFADIDSDDTLQNCRNIEGTSNKITIIDGSKYWAGTGTNEKENDPQKHTITAEIRQNIQKDLHFQKMNW